MKSTTSRNNTTKSTKTLNAYLAGPMEYAANAGLSWRLHYEQELNKLGIKCIIPEFEEKFVTDQAELNRLKKEDIPHYVKIMRQLIDLDLDFVETVDMVVVKWTGERMSGTIGEVQHAYLVSTPAYLVTELDLQEVPGWFLACFTKTFTSLEELTTHIKSHHM